MKSKDFNHARQLRGEDKRSVRKVISALKKQSHQSERRNWRVALRDIDSFEDDVRPIEPANKKLGAYDII